MANKKVKLKKQKNDSQVKITNQVLREAKQSIYLTFNFSFLSQNSSYNHNCKDFTTEQQALLMHRLYELSQIDIISLTAKTKSNGLEKIQNFSSRDKIRSMQLHPEFNSSKRVDLAGNGFWIFRLCPNNNPHPTRIIGKMIDNVFYVMFIDCQHELYAKRR